jgi:hypothetical protein
LNLKAKKKQRKFFGPIHPIKNRISFFCLFIAKNNVVILVGGRGLFFIKKYIFPLLCSDKPPMEKQMLCVLLK